MHELRRGNVPERLRSKRLRRMRGRVDGDAVRADGLVVVHKLRRGHLLGDGGRDVLFELRCGLAAGQFRRDGLRKLQRRCVPVEFRVDGMRELPGGPVLGSLRQHVYRLRRREASRKCGVDGLRELFSRLVLCCER